MKLRRATNQHSRRWEWYLHISTVFWTDGRSTSVSYWTIWTFGRPRSRWEQNIGMDVREIGWKDVDWNHLAQDRDQWRAIVNTAMNIRVA